MEGLTEKMLRDIENIMNSSPRSEYAPAKFIKQMDKVGNHFGNAKIKAYIFGVREVKVLLDNGKSYKIRRQVL